MADNATTPKVGKTISFNLVGDDLHLFDTMKDVFLDEIEADERKVQEALATLPAEAAALVRGRLAPRSKTDLSHRQVFVKALQESLAKRDAEEDARAAAEGASKPAGEPESPAPAE